MLRKEVPPEDFPKSQKAVDEGIVKLLGRSGLQRSKGRSVNMGVERRYAWAQFQNTSTHLDIHQYFDGTTHYVHTIGNPSAVQKIEGHLTMTEGYKPDK